MKTILLIIIGTIVITIWIVYIYLSKEEKKYDSKNNIKNVLLPSLDILTNNTENSLKEILQKTKYNNSDILIPIGINQDNRVEIINLNTSKNILIIGTTGGGKSICLNEIISSSIMKYTSDQIKYLTIDTSIVELSSFNNIPHYIKNTISNPNSIIDELEKIIKIVEKNNNEEHIVIVIDDYYDVLSVDSNRIKSLINKLVELSKVKNIHLIVATDTPSNDYINFEQFDTKIYLTLSPGEEKYFSFDTLSQQEKSYISEIGNMIYINKNKRIPVKATRVLDEEINNIKNFYTK